MSVISLFLCAIFLGFLGITLPDSSSPQHDSRKIPPLSIEHTSSDDSYSFLISSIDGWRTPFPNGVLTRKIHESRKTLWKGLLPLQYGPRFVLVSKTGTVVLFDDFINIKPRYAIYIINISN